MLFIIELILIFPNSNDGGFFFLLQQTDLDEVEVKLLELDESHQSERTVFITPPEPVGLSPSVTYTYDVRYQVHHTYNYLNIFEIICDCQW